MRKVNTTIKYIEPYSIAEDAGIEVGDKLISINGHDFHDILEYRYLTAEYEVTLEILKKDGTTEVITVENDYDDIGIEFEEGLIDEAQSCRNKCIFCFIDQNPPGMRESIYFKDDDSRLSFLHGNYITLTNLRDHDIERDVIARIREFQKTGKKHFIVIVAEGVGGTAEIAKKIEAETGVESRATILGHVQRGGSPTARDRIMASQMGSRAVDLLTQGIGNRVIGIRDNKIVDFDIFEALKMTKTIDMKDYELAHEISI